MERSTLARCKLQLSVTTIIIMDQLTLLSHWELLFEAKNNIDNQKVVMKIANIIFAFKRNGLARRRMVAKVGSLSIMQTEQGTELLVIKMPQWTKVWQ